MFAKCIGSRPTSSEESPNNMETQSMLVEAEATLVEFQATQTEWAMEIARENQLKFDGQCSKRIRGSFKQQAIAKDIPCLKDETGTVVSSWEGALGIAHNHFMKLFNSPLFRLTKQWKRCCKLFAPNYQMKHRQKWRNRYRSMNCQKLQNNWPSRECLAKTKHLSNSFWQSRLRLGPCCLKCCDKGSRSDPFTYN